MEIESAARRHLKGIDDVAGHVGSRVYKFRLEEPLERGGCALVVSRAPGWAASYPRKTSEFPVLWVDCYADPSRFDNGDVKELDAEDKAMSIARTLKKHLHGVRDEWWGAVGTDRGLRIVTCEQWQLPQIIRDRDRHGGRVSDMTMDALGDSVVVRTKWALQTAP